MLIRALLRYVAEGMPATGSAGVQTALLAAPPSVVEWVLQAGLGPLLCRATHTHPASAWSAALLSADWTAQVHHGCRVAVTTEIIDLCRSSGVPVTLLKGISIAGQCYPAGHLRPMGDIDLLIAAGDLQPLDAALRQRGFRQGPPVMSADAHHGEPLFDPVRQVWVELHTGLFPSRSRLADSRLFSPAGLADHTVAAMVDGRPVHRLRTELQLVYIASYWARDLSMHPIAPGFVVPIVDATCLLAASGGSLDWDGLLALIDNDLAAASLLILLGYLSRQGLVPVPPPVLAHLFRRQDLVGRVECRLLDTLVDTHLVAGKRFKPFNSWRLWDNLLQPGWHTGKMAMLPWRLLFPTDAPNRFSVRFQQQRMVHWIRRLQEDRPVR